MDMDLAQTLTNPDNLFTAFVAMITFATMVTIGLPLLNRSSLESRLKSVANRREELRRRSREALAKSAASATQRRESIVSAFPDCLDLLLICVESGMSIEAAIQKVAQEVGGSSIELAEELTLLTAELSYLPERRMAYEGLAKRTNHPGIKAV